jgi:hypothetical protein
MLRVLFRRNPLPAPQQARAISIRQGISGAMMSPVIKNAPYSTLRRPRRSRRSLISLHLTFIEAQAPALPDPRPRFVRKPDMP